MNITSYPPGYAKKKVCAIPFYDTEEPVFVYEEDAPDNGDIMAVNKDGLDDSYKVKYTGQ